MQHPESVVAGVTSSAQVTVTAVALALVVWGGTAVHAFAAGAPAPGIVDTLAGPIDAGTGGMAVDAAGNVYMADFGATLGKGPAGTQVFKISPAGNVDVFARGLSGASGNAFGPEGDLFQANIAGNSVSRIGPDGRVELFAAENLSNPVGIAIDPADGTLFVANCGSNSVARIAASGGAEIMVSHELLRCPNGIARTPDGALYVSNFYNGDVVRITPQGEVARFATVPGNNNGHILYGNGVLYVAARGAHRIYELTLGGDLRVLAGTGERGRRDGAAASATLSLPNDLALSPDGSTLYWNDVGAEEPGTTVLTPSYVRMLGLGPVEKPDSD